MSALENFFVKKVINLQQARFVCMDTKNEKNKWPKKHLEHKVPLLELMG